MTVFLVTLASFFCAIFSGIFGMAGGVLLLAILFGLGYSHFVALPMHGAVMLVSNFSRTLAFFKYIQVKSLGFFVLGSIPSVFFLIPIIEEINYHVLQVVLSVLILYICWAPQKYKFKKSPKSQWSTMMLAGLIGAASALTLGAAATFIAPLFLRDEWSNRTLMGTKSACQSYLQILKIVSFGFLGFKINEHVEILIPMCGAVIVGNLLGVYFISRISQQKYRFLYKAILTLAVLALLTDVVIDHYGKKIF